MWWGGSGVLITLIRTHIAGLSVGHGGDGVNGEYLDDDNDGQD